MKMFLKLLAITLLVLISTTSISITSTNFVKAQAPTPWTWDGGMIGRPPNILLDPSFNPKTVFNPAAPIGGAPFCTSGGLGTILCYPPDFIRKAYDFPTLTTGTSVWENVTDNPAYSMVPAMDGVNGTGQTIVIVDAFGSPTILNDLSNYDGNFSLPAPPSFVIRCGPTWTGVGDTCPTFNSTNTNQVGWAEEITLDVTASHALAPGANIVLVVSNSDFDSDLNAAEMAVVTQPSLMGSIMSQSFGEPDSVVGCINFPTCTLFDPSIKATQDSVYRIAATNHWTVLASSGDDGANEGYRYFSPPKANALIPSSPSTSPYVLAIGGTQGQPYTGTNGQYYPPGPGGTKTCAAGATCNTGLVVMTGGANGCTTAARPGEPTGCTPTGYGGEGAWNEYNDLGSSSSTGGGVSTLYTKPLYQTSLPATFATLPSGTMAASGRLGPDVSFNAAVVGGVLAYLGIAPSLHRWAVFGGTSASSPSWAAIIALLNQVNAGPVGFINPTIYSLAMSPLYSHSFHDITVGNNTNVLPPTLSFKGYPAAAGFDLTTGWGSPDVLNFLTDFMTITQGSISLVPGWNLISIPLVPVTTAINTVLANLIVDNSFTSIFAYQGGSWKSALLTGGGTFSGHVTGTLTTIQDGVGYWIFMTKADTLAYSVPSTGWVIPPAMSPPNYALSLGWNLIGFKPQPTVAPETASSYLASIATKYSTNNVWIYNSSAGTWTRTDGVTVLIGQGMWVYMTTAAVLYP